MPGVPTILTPIIACAHALTLPDDCPTDCMHGAWGFTLAVSAGETRLMSRYARLVALVLLLGFSAVNARDNAAPDAATRKLAFDVFKQLIEINTTDSVGNVTTAAKAMQQRLLDAGFAPGDVVVAGPNERKGNLVVRYRGKGQLKPILLICHLDVVEAKREDWTTDPFQFVEKDGYVYGRGTQDVKVGDAILIATLIRFKREGYVPNRDLIVALTADEEGGTSNGVDWLLKNRRDLVDAEYVLNPDSGGIDSENGKVVDVQLGATEKLYADYLIVATNPGGHSSLPRPDNAIYELSAALEKLRTNPFPFELNTVTRAYFERDAALEPKDVAADMRALTGKTLDVQAAERLSKDARFNSTLRTTCVPTKLEAGHANNALPQQAQALVNCRIFPGHSKEEIRQELIRIVADPKLKILYIATDGSQNDVATDERTPPPPPIRADVLNALDRVSAQMWHGVPVIAEMETGASDSIYTNAAGLPSYGVSGVAIDRDDVRAHGKDERLRVSSFYEGLDFYGRVLRILTTSK
jgi:acetylornithine deacetylase/succinyl-diaminopimelate desuccinylase-like protein